MEKAVGIPDRELSRTEKDPSPKRGRKTVDNVFAARLAAIRPSYLSGEDWESWPRDSEGFHRYLLERFSACESCALSAGRNRVVLPDGRPGARIMVVGEGPGFLEDLAGIPLVGNRELASSPCSNCSKILGCYSTRLLSSPKDRGQPPKNVTCDPEFGASLLPKKFFLRSAGNVLDGILLSLNPPILRQNWMDSEGIPGISPVYITNAVMCRSYDRALAQDRPPEGDALIQCRKNLAMQYALIQPEATVALGRVALSVLMGSQKAASQVYQGSAVQTKFGTVYAQIHPAALMRQKSRTMKSYGYAKIRESFVRAFAEAGMAVS